MRRDVPSPPSLPFGSLEASLTGFLLALFLLSGRWSLARIATSGTPELWLEPRTWAVTLLVVSALRARPPQIVAPASRSRGTLLAFLAWMGVSLAWSPDPDGGLDKLVDLVLLACACLSSHRLARMLGATEILRATWRWLAALCGAIACIAIAMLEPGTLGATGRFAVLGGGPNVFGRNMAMLAIFCFAAGVDGRLRVVLGLGAAGAALLTVLSGSRGALVALCAGLLALAFARRHHPLRTLLVGTGAVLATALLLHGTSVGRAARSSFEERVLRLTLEDEHDAGRREIYRDALELGMRSPIRGEGLGAFETASTFSYPHNLFLEAFCEGGLVALGLLLAFLGPAILAFARRPPPDPRSLAGYVTLLVAAQFSGDFFDSRGVFVFALLLPMSPRPPKR